MATNEKSLAVLTDAEIKKALECCVWNDGCERCPISEKCFFFYNKPYAETPEILRLSLDFINRQQAKIEALQMDNAQLQSDVINANMNCEHTQADNERLKRLLTEEQTKYTNSAKRFYKEGVKDFAEKVKEEVEMISYETCSNYQDTIDAIDETYKEMVGE